MDGRTEKDIKINEKIIDKLNTAPEYVLEWYMYLKSNYKTAKTCRNYINKVLNFLKYIDKDIKNIKLEDITQNKVNMYMSQYTYKENNNNISEYVDSTKLGVWFALNSFFSYLLSVEYISINYMDKIKRVKNNDEIRISENRILLEDSDFNKILNVVVNGAGTLKAINRQKNMKERDYAIMFLFMTTGMREAALTEININDIDFEKKILLTRDKGKIRHKYMLNDKIIEVLKVWIYKRDIILKNKNIDSDALFISNQCKRISEKAVFNLVSKYGFAALGYHISPHKLRGSFIHIMIEKTNGNVEKVKKMVGHSSVAITQRYNDKIYNEKQESMDIMCNLIG